MSIKKILAAAAASVVAVSAMAISASAAIVDKIEPITLDSKSDKMVQYNIALFDMGAINTIQVLGTMPTGEWNGGGGGIGFDTTDGWQQVDFELGKDDAYKVDESGNVDITVTVDGWTADTAKEDGLLQIGWWWGSADVLNITDILINGESVMNKELAAAPTDTESKPEESESKPEESESKPEESESKPEESKPEESKTDETKPNVDTGVEGIAAVVGVAAVAAGALVVAKKRK